MGNPALLVDRGWLILSSIYPHLVITMHHRKTGKLRTFKFTFYDWNDQPPALTIIDPETKQDAPGTLWPRYQSYWHASGWTSAAGISTNIPFMCMAGILEYHTHSSHVGDSWANYKDNTDYSLAGIVLQVSQVYQKSDV